MYYLQVYYVRTTKNVEKKKSLHIIYLYTYYENVIEESQNIKHGSPIETRSITFWCITKENETRILKQYLHVRIYYNTDCNSQGRKNNLSIYHLIN